MPAVPSCCSNPRDRPQGRARKGVPAPIQAGKRWVVERSHAWMNGYGKLRRCTTPGSPTRNEPRRSDCAGISSGDRVTFGGRTAAPAPWRGVRGRAYEAGAVSGTRRRPKYLQPAVTPAGSGQRLVMTFPRV